MPLEEIERQAVTEALRMANWVQKDAADLLGDQSAGDELQDQDSEHRDPAFATGAAGRGRRLNRVHFARGCEDR
jgi:hypothetical protein